MEQNLEKKNNFQEKINFILKKNKIKILIIVASIAILIFSSFLLNENKKKKNVFFSEKYYKATIFLLEGKKLEAKKNLEEVILSKNNIYSLLALNTILEKNLESDSNKILSHFNLLEKLNFSQNTNDLIIFKKALFLIKINDPKTGNKILNDLIEKNSSLKSLAQEIKNN
tara:strand:+ start:860 stop:1369 length:510 start_codon:yes stop_codon:yes gene_type:complete